MTALLAAITLVPVACGQAGGGTTAQAPSPVASTGADETPSPTIGSEALSEEELAALTADTVVLRNVDAEALPVGPPLPTGATAEEIRAAIESLHGPTDDLTAQMNRLVAFPSVPTPSGSWITEVRVDARETLDRSAVTVVAEVTFDAEGSPEQLIELYASELATAGWNLTGRHGRSATVGSAHRATFALPDSAYQLDDLSVMITEPRSEDASGRRSEVLLRYVELQPVGSDTARQRYQDWASGIPLPAGGQITGAGVQTSSVGRQSLHYSLAVRYPETGPDGIADELRSRLPGAGYEVLDRPVYDDKLDNWVYLQGPRFENAWISTHAVETGPDTGSTLVNVDARIDFTPEGARS